MRSYEEIAESLLKRRDEYIENQRVRRNLMKKRIIALSAFCLAVLIGIGVWQADLFKTKPIETPADSTSSKQEAQTENPVESAPVESEQPSTPQTTEQPEPPAVGGDSAWWILNEHESRIADIGTELYYKVGEDVVDEWLKQFYWFNKETYIRTDVNDLIKFIREVGITKELFMSTERSKEFTQEEIELLFSDNYELCDEYFVSEYAVFSNGKIYIPYWFTTNNAEDYIEAGMTKSQLLEKIPLWKEMYEIYGSGGRMTLEKIAKIEAEIAKMP